MKRTTATSPREYSKLGDEEVQSNRSWNFLTGTWTCPDPVGLQGFLRIIMQCITAPARRRPFQICIRQADHRLVGMQEVFVSECVGFAPEDEAIVSAFCLHQAGHAHSAAQSQVPSPKSTRQFQGPRSKVQGPRFKVQGPRSKVQGPRSKNQGPRFKVVGKSYKEEAMQHVSATPTFIHQGCSKPVYIGYRYRFGIYRFYIGYRIGK
jgi:hypothetical protein